MKFGPVAPADALGAVLAHSLTLGKTRLRKGRVLDKADIDGLIAADLAEIIVARLDIGDVPEDTAAAAIARSGEGWGGGGTMAREELATTKPRGLAA